MRGLLACALFGAAFGLSSGLGGAIAASGALPEDAGWLVSALLYGLSGAALSYLLLMLLQRLAPRASGNRLKPRAAVWLALALFAAWTPYFLAYYPGVMGYDLPSQAEQCATNIYTTHHPLLHTFLLKAFFAIGTRLGDHTLAMALYTLCQMALMAAGLSWLIVYARGLGASVTACALTALYFAICPVFPIMSISVTKDTLFSVTLCASALKLYGAAKRGSGYAGFAVFAAITMLLRSNASVAFLFLFVAGVIIIKANKRAFALSCALSLAIFASCSALLSWAVITKPSDAVGEMLSIPAQQLHCVQYETESESEREELARCFMRSYPGSYDPDFADPSKFALNIDAFGLNVPGVDETISVRELMTIWRKYALKYPKLYVQAFLRTNMGAWYAFDMSHAEVYGVGANRQGYIATENRDISSYYSVRHTSFFAGLESLTERLFSYNEYQKCPFLRVVMGTGFHVWAFFLCTALIIALRRRELLLAALWPFGLWATILAGPCTIVRYILPYFILWPLLSALLPVEGGSKAALR